MGSIFSTVKINVAAKPEVLITSLLLQLDAVPNPRWSYKASRVYVTSNNKNQKVAITLAACRHNVNMLLSNSTFFIFAVLVV